MKSWSILSVLIWLLHVHAVSGQLAALQWVHVPEISRKIPNAGITWFVQDQEGFLWFGTEDGLNRYDGMTFRSFQHTPFKQNSIPPGKIISLLCDSKGILWVATDLSGAFSFDPVTETTHQYMHDPSSNNSIAENSIVKMMEDQNGIIWFAHRFGAISCLDTKTQKFAFHTSDVSQPDSLHANTILDLFQSQDGLIWIGTAAHGMECYDPVQNKFIHYAAEKIFKQGKPGMINCIMEDHARNIWFSAHGSIYKLDRNQNRFVVFTESENKEKADVFFNAAINQEGLLFFSSDNGLWIVDPLQSRLQVMHAQVSDQAWTHRVAWHVSCDSDDHVWTCFGGEMYMSTGQAPLPVILNDGQIPGDDSLIPGGYMLNRKYRVTDKGVTVKVFCTGEEKTYPVPPQQIEKLKDPVSGAFFSNSHATTFGIHVGEKSIWMYNEQSRQFDELPEMPGSVSSFTNGNLSNSYVDSHHNFWLGTLDGKVLRYTKDNGWYQLTLRNTNNTIDTNAHVIMFLEDHRGELWIMDYQLGIIKYNYQTNQYKKYQHLESDPFSPAVFYPYSIYEDQQGRLWFGGQGRSLDLYDPNKDRFIHFRKDQAFTHFILRILEDNDGSLWSFNEESITHFIPPDTIDFQQPFQTQFDYTIYSDRKGWKGYNNAFHFGYTDCAGNFYYGNEYGVLHFNSDKLKTVSIDNPFYITQLQINGQEMLPGTKPLLNSIQNVDSITLRYDQNAITLSFAYLDYWHPERHQYKYRLEGLDTNYIYVGADNRTVNYSNLSPGHYVFTVKAETGNDDWDQHVRQLAINIIPAFWQTAWFKFLIGGSLLGLLWMGFRWRMKNVRTIVGEKNKVQELKLEQYRVALELEKIKQQLSEAQLAALRAQMNPHFIFNSLQSINRYIVRSDPDLASHYLTKFSKLIRLILDNSRNTFISLEKELEALQLYVDMELLRFENKFECRFILDKKIQPSELEVPPMIFQPFVENAIWHGIMHKKEKGHIQVTFDQQDDLLLCTVEDDGVGRQRAGELESKSAVKEKSLGMLLTENRLNLINGNHSDHSKVKIEDLVDHEGKPLGTVVTITMPLNYI